ncbi:BTAD domain-containing putative transcriptional regulator [Spongiactinospora sp. 9N601]|uniref:AfsR/SARP family transcriptional regulator n=1 Tax=Spongiactinospora sp. 9N601 TaxID=3375149 RepID=UPI0037AECCA6
MTGAKRRSLFAALLVSPGTVVPIEELARELWGDEPPRNAENALYAHVSRLRTVVTLLRRRSGVPIDLQTRYPGYVLDIQPDVIDITRFRKLYKQASSLRSSDPERAAAALRDALALWRGPALQDVPHGPIRDMEANRLERERMLATTRLIEINLELGRHEELIPDLEALVIRNPLEERLYAQLMRALDSAGRAGDALQIYQLARVRFAEEMGLSPSPALSRQMDEILNRSENG